jgi:hypothetical protein
MGCPAIALKTAVEIKQSRDEAYTRHTETVREGGPSSFRSVMEIPLTSFAGLAA